jgi:serpin B
MALAFALLAYSCEEPIELQLSISPETPQDGPVTPENTMAVLTPEVSGQIRSISLSETGEAYNQAAHSFAFRLLNALYEGKSMVASPLSLQMALSLAASGAQGETLQEILDALGFGALGKDGMNEYSQSLLNQLPAVDTSICLQMANAMVVRDDIKVVDSYRNNLATYYYANAESLDFSQPEQVMKVVNDWCNQNTHGLIPRILEDVNPLTLAYLMNALYLKAGWSSPFDPEYQVKKGQDFRKGNGTIRVDYLADGGHFSYVDKSTYRVAIRPLGARERYFFAVFLPKEDDGLKDMLFQIAGLDWNDLRKEMYSQRLLWQIPKFETASSYDDLVKTMNNLGVKRAFADNAEFDMFEDPETGRTILAHIDAIIQKAKISLDEDGIEAAAVTITGMAGDPGPGTPRPDPLEFFADHPFAYLIYEGTSGTILFTGIYDGNQ